MQITAEISTNQYNSKTSQVLEQFLPKVKSPIWNRGGGQSRRKDRVQRGFVVSEVVPSYNVYKSQDTPDF